MKEPAPLKDIWRFYQEVSGLENRQNKRDLREILRRIRNESEPFDISAGRPTALPFNDHSSQPHSDAYVNSESSNLQNPAGMSYSGNRNSEQYPSRPFGPIGAIIPHRSTTFASTEQASIFNSRKSPASTAFTILGRQHGNQNGRFRSRLGQYTAHRRSTKNWSNHEFTDGLILKLSSTCNVAWFYTFALVKSFIQGSNFQTCYVLTKFGVTIYLGALLFKGLWCFMLVLSDCSRSHLRIAQCVWIGASSMGEFVYLGVSSISILFMHDSTKAERLSEQQQEVPVSSKGQRAASTDEVKRESAQELLLNSFESLSEANGMVELSFPYLSNLSTLFTSSDQKHKDLMDGLHGFTAIGSEIVDARGEMTNANREALENAQKVIKRGQSRLWQFKQNFFGQLSAAEAQEHDLDTIYRNIQDKYSKIFHQLILRAAELNDALQAYEREVTQYNHFSNHGFDQISTAHREQFDTWWYRSNPQRWLDKSGAAKSSKEKSRKAEILVECAGKAQLSCSRARNYVKSAKEGLAKIKNPNIDQAAMAIDNFAQTLGVQSKADTFNEAMHNYFERASAVVRQQNDFSQLSTEMGLGLDFSTLCCIVLVAMIVYIFFFWF